MSRLLYVYIKMSVCLYLSAIIIFAMMYLRLPQYTSAARDSFGTTSPGINVGFLVIPHERSGSCIMAIQHGARCDTWFRLSSGQARNLPAVSWTWSARHYLLRLPKHTKLIRTQSLCCLLQIVQPTTFGMSPASNDGGATSNDSMGVSCPLSDCGQAT